jgi:ribosomal protein S19E (S16A)
VKENKRWLPHRVLWAEMAMGRQRTSIDRAWYSWRAWCSLRLMSPIGMNSVLRTRKLFGTRANRGEAESGNRSTESCGRRDADDEEGRKPGKDRKLASVHVYVINMN